MVRDCLFLNWALAVDRLPPPPAPLRYQIAPGAGPDRVFATALLFRQEGLRFTRLPLLRVSHPQFNLRLSVLDEEDIPSVLFVRILVPMWIFAGVRWMAHQPARVARFWFPSPSRNPKAPSWSWRVSRGADLKLVASMAAPAVADRDGGPDFESWSQQVDFIRQRPRGYLPSRDGLRRVDTVHPSTNVWPLKVEMQDVGLLRASLSLPPTDPWPPLYSSWLCPDIPMSFELLGRPAVRLPRQVPATG